MNPWAGFVVLIGIGIIVMAWNGQQDNVIAAITGKPHSGMTLQQ